MDWQLFFALFLDEVTTIALPKQSKVVKSALDNKELLEEYLVNRSKI